MTPTALLSELQNQGVILEPRGDKLAFGPREKVTPELREKIVDHKAELLRLLQPASLLAQAYWRYWTLPESEPMETFQVILAEIATFEARLDPGKVIDILEAEAQRFHRETGRCPHCRQAGPFHRKPTGRDGDFR